MSFNLNFNNNLPSITAAQGSQDGGAGNLGYMKGGGKGNSKQHQESNSIFEEEQDSFTKEGFERAETFDSVIDRFILTFKLIIKRIFRR